MAERTTSPHRFFVDPASIVGDVARVEGAQAHQLARVLRVRVGERVVLLDGTGVEYVVEVTAVTPKLVEGIVRASQPSAGEPRLAITLYQALVTRE